MYEKFKNWLEETLKDSLPKEVKALNFNLYEDEDNTWSVELVGTSSFDEEDDDWACDEVFSNRDNALAWTEESDWEEVQEKMESIIKEYLENGAYAEILKGYAGIGVGFVDGDIEIVYKK